MALEKFVNVLLFFISINLFIIMIFAVYGFIYNIKLQKYLSMEHSEEYQAISDYNKTMGVLKLKYIKFLFNKEVFDDDMIRTYKNKIQASIKAVVLITLAMILFVVIYTVFGKFFIFKG